MTYALVQENTIALVGALPDLWHDGTRWWDFRQPSGELLTSLGWLPVVETPRPTDTATDTHDYSVEFVGGVPTVTWTPRPWTADELVQREYEANRVALREDTATELIKLDEAIADLTAKLAAAPAVGSIRTHKAAITNSYSAALARDVDDFLIDLARDMKKIARQVARLARQQVGDFSTSDVGPE